MPSLAQLCMTGANGLTAAAADLVELLVLYGQVLHGGLADLAEDALRVHLVDDEVVLGGEHFLFLNCTNSYLCPACLEGAST